MRNTWYDLLWFVESNLDIPWSARFIQQDSDSNELVHLGYKWQVLSFALNYASFHHVLTLCSETWAKLARSHLCICPEPLVFEYQANRTKKKFWLFRHSQTNLPWSWHTANVSLVFSSAEQVEPGRCTIQTLFCICCQVVPSCGHWYYNSLEP